jgi:FAD-linked sulfhydryl oxidase
MTDQKHDPIFKTDGGSKPCRACTDFKSWMHLGGPTATKTATNTPEDKANTDTNNKADKKIVAENKADSSSKEEAKDNKQDNIASPVVDLAARDHKAGVCPPDSLELGSATWTFLHSVAAYYPENPTDQHKQDALNLINSLPRLYPCAPCAEDLSVDLPQHPPQVDNSKQFSEWMCRLHNRVNVKLGKPEFDCSKVFLRWRYGWEDGSCD